MDKAKCDSHGRTYEIQSYRSYKYCKPRPTSTLIVQEERYMLNDLLLIIKKQIPIIPFGAKKKKTLAIWITKESLTYQSFVPNNKTNNFFGILSSKIIWSIVSPWATQRFDFERLVTSCKQVLQFQAIKAPDCHVLVHALALHFRLPSNTQHSSSGSSFEFTFSMTGY